MSTSSSAAGATSMPWLGPVAIGADVLGGALNGIQQARSAAADRRLQSGMFARTQGLQEANEALAMQQRIQNAPLRDQLQYLLQQRLGIGAPAFHPTNPFQNPEQGGMPASGGATAALEALQHAGAGYAPGAGGVTSDTEREIQRRLGYTPGDYRGVNFGPGGAAAQAQAQAARAQALQGSSSPWLRKAGSMVGGY